MVGQITARGILSALLSMTYIYTCINNTICINICHREQNGKEANVVKWEISIYDIIELKYLLLLLKSYPKSFERRRWRKEILELSWIFCTHYILYVYLTIRSCILYINLIFLKFNFRMTFLVLWKGYTTFTLFISQLPNSDTCISIYIPKVGLFLISYSIV